MTIALSARTAMQTTRETRQDHKNKYQQPCYGTTNGKHNAHSRNDLNRRPDAKNKREKMAAIAAASKTIAFLSMFTKRLTSSMSRWRIRLCRFGLRVCHAGKFSETIFRTIILIVVILDRGGPFRAFSFASSLCGFVS